MNAATALLIKKYAEKAGKEIIEYLEHDQMVMLGMRREQWATLSGPGIGMGYYADDVLTIDSTLGGNSVNLRSRPFAAETQNWNGPDIISNTLDDGSLESSFWHDLIFGRKAKIAKAWGITEEQVMHWANGILAGAWKGYAALYPDPKKVDFRVKVAYRTIEYGHPWYYPAKRILERIYKAVVLVALITCVAGCTNGCIDPPDYKLEASSGIMGGDTYTVRPWISTNAVEGAH